ncbi:sodium/glucose cotransporter 4-like [Mya arenaria]|uniref:sodium/glucose cotransporter 4-like n=1 Tax=Mya arenaria TaxID=6604 RepID=UPI0022E9341C|nr:sodium/glucose cotransporter 4-like [Mya arenaria]XP_052771468.1 sodium/glucose cotransporter 4-like [Mya arenaria]XP_052771469.1 sodium/glucose cotransporter 4-like [Mya arenaria]
MADTALTHWADILTIILYFVFVLAVGIWSIWRRKKGNVENYFLAGRSMPWFAVGASLFGSNIGSEHFIGLAGSGAANGIVFVLFEWIPALLVQLLSWFFLPVFISAGVYTLPEYMERRFGRGRLRIYLSVLALFLHIVNRLSATIFSGAIYIQLAFRWNMYPSIVGILLITGIFTIFGGLTAVMYTDTAQSVIMVIGAIVVMGLSLGQIGGLSNVEEAYSQSMASTVFPNSTCGLPRSDAFHVLRGMDADFPWPTMILQAGVASAWYWICDQIMVQRCLAARNISHAKSGTLLGGYLKILPLFIMIIPGMISRILYPDEVACADPETCLKVCDNAAGCSNIAYPKLVLELLPKGARGLIMAVMLSAIVTSLTSIFNSSSTVFTMDIWRRFRPAAKQKELLLVGRLYIIALCGLTIAWIPVVKAAQGGQLFQYIVVIEGFITAPLPILFALVVFWDRTSEQGAFYSILIANVLGLARFVLEAVYPVPNCGEPDTRPGFLSKVHSFYYSEMIMLIQLILTVAISLCTKPVPKEQLKGTTWSTRIKPGVIDKLNEDGLVMKEVSVDFQNSDTEDCSQATENNELLENGNAIEQVAIMKSNRLRDFLRNVCGVTEGDDNVSVEINVKDRRTFLTETSKRIMTVNNILAIMLIAAMCFLIGKYA